MSRARRRLQGARFLVTGASSGLGFAIADALQQRGTEVWGTSRSGAVEAMPEGVSALPLDLSVAGAADVFWREQGVGDLKLDGLVNNAGFAVFGGGDRLPFKAVESQLDCLLHGAIRLSQLALPGLIERGGVLANVSSLAAEFPIPFQGVYSAAKAGLSAYTECLMMEQEGSGLQVIDFRPGDLKTQFHRRMGLPDSEKGSAKASVVWKKIQERTEKSPSPEKAACRLVSAIESGRSGMWRAGSVFQAAIAPFLARFGSQNLKRRVNDHYYR